MGSIERAKTPDNHLEDWRVRLTACLRQRVLDREIAAGLPVDGTRARALRACQLSSTFERRAIAACVQTFLDCAEAEADQGRALTGVRAALIASRCEIGALIDSLRSESVVDARGVALAQLLIEDRVGPLFHPRPKHSLRERLTEAIGALQAHRGDLSGPVAGSRQVSCRFSI